jgi:hypothetical protein
MVLIFVLPHIAQMTGSCHSTQSLIEMDLANVRLAWPQTAILLISAIRIARIT